MISDGNKISQVKLYKMTLSLEDFMKKYNLEEDTSIEIEFRKV